MPTQYRDAINMMQASNEAAIPGTTIMSKAVCKALATVTARKDISTDTAITILKEISKEWVSVHVPAAEAKTLEDTLSDIRITE